MAEDKAPLAGIDPIADLVAGWHLPMSSPTGGRWARLRARPVG
jgi:hypothetical protein